MTAEDFEQIERELSLSLPATYRAALERPEFNSEAAGFQEFSGDSDEIIGLNLDCRESGFCGLAWPKHYFVIGEDGAGNFYFTDLNQERPAVLLVDCERTTAQKKLVTSESYDTFPDFIAFLHRLNEVAEAEALLDEDAMLDQTEMPKRPWWQFWRGAR